MKTNPIRYSSAVGELWAMATFKVKYCHKVFDIRAVRETCEALLVEALTKYNVRYRKIAFDSDHVHFIIDMGLYSKPVLAKKLRGYIGFHIFRLLPWLKQTQFWGSGFWNPAYDIRGVQDIAMYERYLDKQKYAVKGQKTLLGY